MNDFSHATEQAVGSTLRLRKSRGRSSHAEVYPIVSSCENYLNLKNGELKNFSDINEYIAVFASSPERLSKIAVVVNADATITESRKAGALTDAAKKWFKSKYKVTTVDVLHYTVPSKDYLLLLNTWSSENKGSKSQTNTHDDASRVQKKIDELFVDAYKKNASDIHFEIRQKQAEIRYRIDGELRNQRHMNPEEAESMANVIWGKIVEGQGSSYNPKSDGASGAAERSIIVDGRPENIRLRMQVLPHRSHAYDMQMRFMATLDVQNEPNLGALGYRKQDAEALERAIRHSDGLILFSGQTGSGKTTTLATLTQMYMRINTAPTGDLLKKIVSVEDPVEIVIPGITQIQLEGKGRETLDERMQRYAEPIRWALRGDPDMLVVSEIREPAGANTVVSGVQSGHLCLSTVHAGSTFGIFNRMSSQSIGVSRDVLSDRDFIRALCNQTLVQTLCPDCKVPLKYSPELTVAGQGGKFNYYKDVCDELDGLAIDQSKIAVRNPEGCKKCNSTGVVGVRVIAETLVPNDDILSFVKDGKINDARRFWASEMKGISIVDHALILIEQGLIDPYRIFTTYGGLTPTNFVSGME